MCSLGMEVTGWLLDLFADPDGGVVLWLLGEDGLPQRLHQPFPATFYAAGPAPRLRALWRFLQSQSVPVRLARTERRRLFAEQPLTVLSIQVAPPLAQARLFRQVARAFPDLAYFAAQLPLTLRA